MHSKCFTFKPSHLCYACMQVVYPKFDVLAKNWLMLASEQKTVSACESVLQTLMAYRMSFKPTLPRVRCCVSVYGQTGRQIERYR